MLSSALRSAFFTVLMTQAQYAQPVATYHYVVENPAPEEYRGVVWLPGHAGPFVVTTTHAPDLPKDQAERRAVELPSQLVGERLAVVLSLGAGEKKVVSVHVGEPAQIARVKAAYPHVCDARLTARGKEAFWESNRVAYILRAGRVEALGKLSSRSLQVQDRVPLAVFDLPVAMDTPEVIAAGTAAAVVQSGATLLTIRRNSRWTDVDLPYSGNLDIALPKRTGQTPSAGASWVATLAGHPAVGMALRADPALIVEATSGQLLLRPAADGRIRYSFAAFWERELGENILEHGEGDDPLPRVPGMEHPNTSGRILHRPPAMQTLAQFEARLHADILHFDAPPRVIALPREPVAPAPPVKPYDRALHLLLERQRTLHQKAGGKFWFSSDPAGTPKYVKPNTTWGDGYLVSILWDGFAVTRDEWFRDAAIQANRRMIGAEDREFHITGLNYWDASARSYQETRDAEWRSSGLRAAATMARIADPITGLIPEYGPAVRRKPSDPYDQMNYVKVDALVGLPILWWAYEQTGQSKYRDIARRHVESTLKGLVEPDGSVLQMLWHDPKTGGILGIGTHQGYGGSSRWARGIAWLLDGLPDAYRVTRGDTYRAYFERSARWLEANLPQDLISWYDFDDQGIFWRYRDSSTTAICAYGLVRMSELEPDRKMAAYYKNLGQRLVNALIDRCVTPVTPSDSRPPGMLAEATYTKPVEGEFIWGNFSLIRALCWLRTNGATR